MRLHTDEPVFQSPVGGSEADEQGRKIGMIEFIKLENFE